MAEQFLVHVAIIWQVSKRSTTFFIVPLNNKFVKLNLGRKRETEREKFKLVVLYLPCSQAFCIAVDIKLGQQFYY